MNLTNSHKFQVGDRIPQADGDVYTVLAYDGQDFDGDPCYKVLSNYPGATPGYISEADLCRQWVLPGLSEEIGQLFEQRKAEAGICRCDSRQLFNFGHEANCGYRRGKG